MKTYKPGEARVTDDGEKKRFLITGGAGFIGSHLAETLLAGGHYVNVIDDLSTGTIDNIKSLLPDPNFHFARATITDEVVMDRIVSQTDTIFHLAAAVGVQLIVDHPVHTIETNVMGTEAVLKSALRYGCKVLLASTSEVYGKGNSLPFREDDDVLLGPTTKSRWSYAASKMVDEFLGFAYMREFGLPVVIVRLFNTVGPRQTGRYGMVLPRFVRQALCGEPITVYGDGTQQRCFCYVGDVVQALIRLEAHPDAPGHVFNVGSPEELSIIDLASRVKEFTRSQSPIVLVPYNEAYGPGFEDMYRRVPDITRITSFTGWKPSVSVQAILEKVVGFERKKLGFVDREIGCAK